MGSRSVWLGAWGLLSLGGSVAVSLDCGGLQPLPPYYPTPTPDGADVDVWCGSPAGPPAAGAGVRPSPVAFDARLTAWPARTECFADGQPLLRPAVRAGDVHPSWNPHQRELFPEHDARHEAMLVPIGGDYWRQTPYPIGPESAAPWVSSAFRSARPDALADDRGDAPTGVMTSRPFAIDSPYIRIAIGGDDDPDVGVELLVKPDASRNLSRCLSMGGGVGRSRLSAALPDGFVLAAVRRGRAGVRGTEREWLEPVDIPTHDASCDLLGLQGILRIVDLSTTAHVNVGAIETAETPVSSADEARIPVWGFADFHTHPTNYLGFGGLQGLHTIWGAPGGSMHEYVDPAPARTNFARDVPPCDDPHLAYDGHHGGLAAPAMINGAEGRLTASLQDLALTAIADEHGSQGGPTFADFPDFRGGAHEQYHVTQIHRAYLGGLRLMTALAVHNPGLEYGVGWVRCGDGGNPTVDTTNDWTVLRAHVRAMKQLAQLNDDWMEIAYSPEDARRIIRQNKLAVVLGSEVPELGNEGEGNPEQQVSALEAMGIRQVVLIHGMDNLLAGTAVFEDLYNTVNDWMHRKSEDRDKVQTLSGLATWTQFPASFYRITTEASPAISVVPGGGPSEATEPIAYRLSNPERVVLSDIFPRPDGLTYQLPFVDATFGVLHPLVNTTPLFKTVQGQYDMDRGGHRNSRGLTGRGAEFVERLMQHGMLVDLAHMSDATLAAVYDLTAKKCSSYPLMVSHAHFRPLALKVDYSDRLDDFVTRTSGWVRADLLKGVLVSDCIHQHTCDPRVLNEAIEASKQAPQLGPGTVNRENLAREFDIASSEVQQIRGRNGAIGVFMGQGPLDASVLGEDGSLPDGLKTLPLMDDCAGSSKGLAGALLYGAARMMNRGALGLASDFTLIGNTTPRFGPNACANYLGAGSSSSSGAQLLETLLDPGHYRFEAQRDAVVYTSRVKTCTSDPAVHTVACGSNEALVPYALGERTYDFNVDGLAHYGLVPDLLQDVANVLHDARGGALDRVFESANGFIEMWEAARAISGCEGHGSCPSPPHTLDSQCTGVIQIRPECGNSCPCGWNRGAPLQEVREVKGVCDPGRAIRFPVNDPAGKPAFVAALYDQHAADPLQGGADVTRQGDWAIYPIGPGQTWVCGGGTPQALTCPDSASYVKVRRVLDTTVSTFVERCDYQPLPPEVGNRRVEFLCLVGAPHAGPVRPQR